MTFWGAGTGQQGIYAALYGTLTKIADLNTSIPGGTGRFTNFQPSDPMISGGNVAFVGNGALNSQGVYARLIPSDPIIPGDPIKVADFNTAIPGGTGNFDSFLMRAGISGKNVVFVGTGADAQEGVYNIPSDPIIPTDPIKVADRNTPIPGGTGNFRNFAPIDPCIGGDNIAFSGTDGDGGQGVYRLFPGIPGDPVAPIANPNTPVPGGTGKFNTFSSISLDGTNVAFVGGVLTENADGSFLSQQGVYVFQLSASLAKVADMNTVVPGGTTTFTGFGNVAIDPSHVVFEGISSPDDSTDVHGLYTNLTGTLTKLVDTRDTINGKNLSAIHFGSGGFSGNQVAFGAEFSDGSQSIVMATVSGNRCPQSQGFWKNHTAQWPQDSLILGNQSYSKSELLNILNTSSTSDASLVLARQLIAAKLNIGNFSNPNPVSSTIADADHLLAGFLKKLPNNVKTNSSAGKAMLVDANRLESYNSGGLTQGCTP